LAALSQPEAAVNPVVEARLQRLTAPELQALAQGRVPAAWLADDTPTTVPGAPALADALPPGYAAARALALQDAHAAAPLAGALYGIWCGPQLVGSCGFKDAADQGWAEIGYGIAAAYRRRGLGRQAVAALCRLAWGSGTLTVLRACIEPGNAASAALVAGLGFQPGPLLTEEDGTTVIVWSLVRPSLTA
jgi:RimJ/RimL family protein N-acetyltransferase